MAFLKRTWTNRVSEYPTRRKLTNVDTQDEMTVLVERDEGVITQEGDAFSRNNMNDLEQRIQDAFNDEHTYLTAILAAGERVVTFTSEQITDGCRAHIFVPFDKCKLIYDNIEMPSPGQLRVTFPAQSTDTVIQLKIDNLNNGGEDADNRYY